MSTVSESSWVHSILLLNMQACFSSLVHMLRSMQASSRDVWAMLPDMK